VRERSCSREDPLPSWIVTCIRMDGNTHHLERHVWLFGFFSAVWVVE
jgi:hypothetical protein